MRINDNTSQASVFISSTFVDLKTERLGVAKALQQRGINVNALDVSPASSTNSQTIIKRGIAESDFVILIVGNRYGSFAPKITGSDSISVTHWEYNFAMARGKNVLVFFMDWGPTEKFSSEKHDGGSIAEQQFKLKCLTAFKDKLTDKHNPRYATSGEILIALVSQSLIPEYRNGVRDLLVQNKKLKDELSEGKAKIDTLEKQLAKLTTTGDSFGNQPGFKGQGLLGLANIVPKNEPSGLFDMLKGSEGLSYSPDEGLGLFQGLLSQSQKK